MQLKLMDGCRPRIRAARADELRAIYLMGYDAWGRGGSIDAYLLECERSPKYASGKWYVLEIAGRLLSALICYRNVFGLPQGAWGLGSLATSPESRRCGYASALIGEVLRIEEGPTFLHADIAPAFYRRFGFVELSIRMQGAGSSIMVRGSLPEGFRPPSYF
ncbi:MAG: GNAT family N-acetyltransferase [Elusimicrobia bacterium]|nr:GNAT family N-acetyltransferase [Elusimicrobiota bacterium]